MVVVEERPAAAGLPAAEERSGRPVVVVDEGYAVAEGLAERSAVEGLAVVVEEKFVRPDAWKKLVVLEHAAAVLKPGQSAVSAAELEERVGNSVDVVATIVEVGYVAGELGVGERMVGGKLRVVQQVSRVKAVKSLKSADSASGNFAELIEKLQKKNCSYQDNGQDQSEKVYTVQAELSCSH